jgi:hypothetical protein
MSTCRPSPRPTWCCPRPRKGRRKSRRG